MSGDGCCGFDGGFGGASGAAPADGIAVEDEGAAVSPDPFDTLNFIGSGVVATDGGGGTANITIPGTTYADENIPVGGAPHTNVNFIGDGVSATDAGGGTVNVTIPGGISGLDIFDDGAPVGGGNTFQQLDFVGDGVVATDGGGGLANITIPGIQFLDEGVPIVGAPHTAVNFFGFGVGAGDAGGGLAQVGVAAWCYAPPEVWTQSNVPANQTNVALGVLVSANFNTVKPSRNGWIVGLTTRLTVPILTGTLTVEVTLNGAGTGVLLAHDNTTNPTGGTVTFDPGLVLYLTGDLIGMRITTTADFTPTTTDLEAWMTLGEPLEP